MLMNRSGLSDDDLFRLSLHAVDADTFLAHVQYSPGTIARFWSAMTEHQHVLCLMHQSLQFWWMLPDKTKTELALFENAMDFIPIERLLMFLVDDNFSVRVHAQKTLQRINNYGN